MSAADTQWQSATSAPASGWRANSLASSLAWMIGLAIVQRGLGFIRELLFCRWLDAAELGQWAMTFDFLMAAAAIVAIGIQGSMSRYAEYYRQRGQLRGYISRVIAASAILGLLSAMLIVAFPEAFSNLIFGHPNQVGHVQVIAIGLVIVLANNFLADYFAALRMFRYVSFVHALNGLCFVVMGISIAAWAGPSAIHITAAFLASMLVAITVLGIIARHVWSHLPVDTSHVVARSFWPHVLCAALALWCYNCLTNTQERIDKYLIIHFSGLTEAAALAMVGNYHTARVIPLVLLTIAILISSTVMPHLSHDWERGRRREVGEQLATIVKLLALGLFAAACSVLVLAPIVFEWGWLGKYADGERILPIVLAQCVWTGLAITTFNYLWCAERLRMVVVALLAAIGVNVTYNLLLVERFGLGGVAIAAAAGSAVLLTLAAVFSHRQGMPFNRSVILAVALPASLLFGAPAALTTLTITLALAAFGETIVTQAEKQRLWDAWSKIGNRN